jgi:ligand-binding sensor domain-containing protein
LHSERLIGFIVQFWPRYPSIYPYTLQKLIEISFIYDYYVRILIIGYHLEDKSKMNTLHKYLIIIFLAVSVFISGLSAERVRAQGVGPELMEPQKFNFKHLSSKEGLSDDKVRAILKDSHGFMWFGTWVGLNRYDGYQFKIYKKQLNNSNSLSNDIITAIHEDKSGKLWLGTIGGLNRFDPTTEMFKRYVHNPQDSESLSNDILVSITEDRNGNFWIGTWGGGLIHFDPVTERFSSYLHDPQNPLSISGDYVTAVHQARDSRFWVMTRFNGLNLFDHSAQTFRHFPLSKNDEGSDWGQSIIHEDQSGTLWFTSREALYAINPKNYKLIQYTLKNNDEFKIKGVVAGTRGDLWVYGHGKKYSLYKFDKENKKFSPYKTRERIVAMYRDDSGLIWIGTIRFGIMLFDERPPKFSHVAYDPASKKGLPDKQITSLLEDHSGNFWLGTSKNVLHWNRKAGEFKTLQDNSRTSAGVRKDSRCWNVFTDENGKIWFTSEDYGLDRFDPVTGNIKNYRHIPGDKKSLTSNYTRAIFGDKNHNIWIGTDKGLNRYDPDFDRFDRFYIDPSKPENPLNNITTIIEDSNGFLWTGSWYGGLSRFDKTKGQFAISYRHAPNDSNSISSNTVNVIHERHDGRFWVGTSNGLSLFDPETDKFKHFTENNGLPNSYVKGILEDDKQRLWISTNKGLTLFNPETKVFRNYDISDGLHSNQFIQGSYTKSSSGEFFFGGMNGFSYFYPERVKDNPYIPPIHITRFLLFNKSVPIGSDSILTRAIWSTDRILLSHQQNFFSLEFASLSYRFPEKNRFRYRLSGLDQNWNEVDSKRRYVTYTSLDPGQYVFRVQGSNNDGVWNEKGTSLTINMVHQN